MAKTRGVELAGGTLERGKKQFLEAEIPVFVDTDVFRISCPDVLLLFKLFGSIVRSLRKLVRLGLGGRPELRSWNLVQRFHLVMARYQKTAIDSSRIALSREYSR